MTEPNPNIIALRIAEDGQQRCRAEIDDLKRQTREKGVELRDWDRKVAEAIAVLLGRAPASLFDAVEPPPEPVATLPGPGHYGDRVAVDEAPAPALDLSAIEPEAPESDGLPADVRAQGLALIGVPSAVLKKLDQFGEIATVGDLWDWVEEDRYDVGGMANDRGLWECLKHIKVASQQIGPTVDAVYSFLKAKGCDPRPAAVDLDAPIAKPGDVVRSSYGTGPYTVKSVERHGSRGGRPTWTLTFQPRGKGEKEGGLINDLQRQSDGRITAKNGDEVIVLPAGTEPGPTYWDWSRPLGDAATANAELQRLWMHGKPLPRADKPSGVLEAQGDASAWAGFIDPAQVPAVGDLPLCRVDGMPASIWQDLDKPLHKVKTIGDLAKKVEELNFAGDLGEQVYATIAQLLGRDGFLVTMARDAVVSLLRPNAPEQHLSSIDRFPEQAAASLERKGITTLSKLREYVVEEGTPLRTSAYAFLSAIPGISKPVAGTAADVIADLLEPKPAKAETPTPKRKRKESVA